MNITQLQSEIAIVKAEAAHKIKALKRDYAHENNPFKVGDLIHCQSTDQRLLIDKLLLDLTQETPSMAYEGIVYTKRNTPTASQKRNRIHQRRYGNVESKIIKLN